MNLISERNVSGGKEVGAPMAKSLVYSSVKERFIQRLFMIAPKQHCKPLSVDMSHPDTVIHSDVWRGYDGLVENGFDKHFRVHHGDNEFASGERHINGIESFWSFAKKTFGKVQWRTCTYFLPAP